MEYEELEKLWKTYDSKLDKLEKINKKLLRETLIKKPNKKLNRFKFNSMYGFIIVPLVLVISMHPNFTKDNLDWKLISGSLLMLLVIIYLGIFNMKSFLLLKKINLGKDSIIDSLKRIIEFKKLHQSIWKYALIYYPVICLGGLLISWNHFTFTNKTILFLVVFFIVTYIANILGPRLNNLRITKFEKDVLDLNEYIDD